jgi:hypothetical protein
MTDGTDQDSRLVTGSTFFSRARERLTFDAPAALTDHLASQQNRPLLDHLVGAGEQRRYRAAFLNHALYFVATILTPPILRS